MKYKTTKKHFEIFKKECRKWIERYGLKDWEIRILHEDYEDSEEGYCGYSYFNNTAKNGRIYLQKTTWRTKPTPEKVRLTARHEVRHLLLVPLHVLAQSRFISEDEIEEESHAVIHRLENATYG